MKPRNSPPYLDTSDTLTFFPIYEWHQSHKTRNPKKHTALRFFSAHLTHETSRPQALWIAGEARGSNSEGACPGQKTLRAADHGCSVVFMSKRCGRSRRPVSRHAAFGQKMLLQQRLAKGAWRLAFRRCCCCPGPRRSHCPGLVEEPGLPGDRRHRWFGVDWWHPCACLPVEGSRRSGVRPTCTGGSAWVGVQGCTWPRCGWRTRHSCSTWRNE